MSVLATFLVKLLVGLLTYIQGREDLKRAVLAEAQLRADQRAIAALRWMAAAAARPDGGAGLRAEPGAPTITGFDPAPPDPGGGGDLPRQ